MVSRTLRGHGVSASRVVAPCGQRPEFFGNERHERVQQLEDFVARPRHHGAGLGLRGAVLAEQDRLGEFQIPVAIDVPDETVDRTRGVVEAIGVDRRGDFARSQHGLMRDPAVQRLLGFGGVEFRRRFAAVHFGETAGIPQLGREISVPLDALRGELDVAALRRHRRQREAERIGAVIVDQVQGIDDIALRLRHLRAFLVANQGVDVNRRERSVLHEMEAHHHHPGDPEEDDVEAGDEDVGRVIASYIGFVVGPAQRRERPQCRGEPGVEHVLVATNEAFAFRRIERHLATLLGRDDLLFDVIAERVADGLFLGFGDKHLIVRSIPCRNLVTPPKLTRDAPGLDIVHPFKVGLLPVLRDKTGRAAAHRGDRGLRHRPGVDIPLVGQIGLDHHAGAVAMRHHVRVGLDPLQEAEILQP